ncbi:MAG: sporulation protein YqfC [Firmicutes bacterium]|nr:sporulation protein YqfC [Bacillota bacterium]
MRSARCRELIKGASQFLDLPEEVILALPKVTVIAGVQVIIENHRGVIQYRPSCLRIRTSAGELRLEGTNLSIASINATEIVVDGKLSAMFLPTASETEGER